MTLFVLLVDHTVNIRSRSELDEALALLRQGLTPTEIARETGIPRSTVRDWRHGRGTRQARRLDCADHDFSLLDGDAYAYLLGMYLGDGCLSRHPRGVWRLRVTLDSAYPRIVAECASAMGAVSPRSRVHVLRRTSGRCVDVSSYWKHELALRRAQVEAEVVGRDVEPLLARFLEQPREVDDAPAQTVELRHHDPGRLPGPARRESRFEPRSLQRFSA